LKLHSHQFYELNIITAGEGQHYVGDTSLPARAGDVFLIPPEMPHGYHSEGRLDIFHVLLRAAFMQRYREELAALPAHTLLFDVEPHLRRSSGQSCHLHLPAHVRETLAADAERIARAEQNREFAYANVLTLALIGRLGELLRRSLHRDPQQTEARELLEVMEFVRENCEQRLTLDALAAKARMSKATLNRRFGELLHQSPMQYVLHCRLEKARALLAAHSYTKTEVAQLCGFYDVAHLNKYL
jgi:AraC family L-rhamnose operon transcriptional activator RhaR